MELSGLACAQALAKVYRNDVYPRVLVCCGPGNQGMFGSSDDQRQLTISCVKEETDLSPPAISVSQESLMRRL